MPLEENVEHEAVLVHSPPKPVSNAVNSRTHLVQMPPGTPSGFPVIQILRKEGSEFDAPFAQGFVTDHNAAHVEQFLNIPVTQGKSVVKPDSVLDDGHGEAVAVRFRVSHGRPAYPGPS